MSIYSAYTVVTSCLVHQTCPHVELEYCILFLCLTCHLTSCLSSYLPTYIYFSTYACADTVSYTYVEQSFSYILQIPMHSHRCLPSQLSSMSAQLSSISVFPAVIHICLLSYHLCFFPANMYVCFSSCLLWLPSSHLPSLSSQLASMSVFLVLIYVCLPIYNLCLSSKLLYLSVSPVSIYVCFCSYRLYDFPVTSYICISSYLLYLIYQAAS